MVIDLFDFTNPRKSQARIQILVKKCIDKAGILSIIELAYANQDGLI